MQRSVTKDTLFNGEVICSQHSNGYRFSIDPVLLAHFTQPKEGARILDLGTGCGIICLILAYRMENGAKNIQAIEIQKDLANLAQQNVSANHLDESIKIIKGDLKNILSYYSAESFENVYCNPPFYELGAGRINTVDEIVKARHQVLANLGDVVQACSKVVINKGAVSLIYPAENVHSLMYSLHKHRLTLKRIQFIYSYPESDKPAKLVLVEAVKNGGKGSQVLPPFYIYSEKNGEYSQQMQYLYSNKQ